MARPLNTRASGAAGVIKPLASGARRGPASCQRPRRSPGLAILSAARDRHDGAVTTGVRGRLPYQRSSCVSLDGGEERFQTDCLTLAGV
jgi:hypothetical protein